MLDVSELKKFGVLKKYPKGTIIFNQGDPGEEMLIILTGKVSVSINSDFGGVINIAELTPGNFVGEMSVLESQPRSATVTALEDTIVLTIDKTNFLNFITNKPEWAFKIMQALSSRIRKINEKFAKSNMKEESIQEIIEKIIPKNEQKQKDTNQNLIIFPPNHKNYDLNTPQEYSQYLYQKEITCPVCNNIFQVIAVKVTKLRLVKITDDFREIHENFDKLWYNIWSCPNCYYSNFSFDFLNLDKKTSEKLYMELLDFKKNNIIELSTNPRNINDVFTQYYLALYSKKLAKKADFKIGKLWLNIAWLYQDVNDLEMYNFAYKTARENYEYMLLKQL